MENIALLENNTLINISIVLFGLILIITQRLFFRLFILKANSTNNAWDDILLKSTKNPLSLSIALIAATTLIHSILNSMDIEPYFDVENFRNTALILLATLALLNITKATESEWLQKNKDSKLVTVSRAIRALIFVSAAIMILQTLGVSISGLMAVGGMSSIVIGMAAKDAFSSILGGIRIMYLDRPFEVGDWIRSTSADIEGTVIKINIRETKIRRFNTNEVSIPNSFWNTAPVENVSRMTNRRLYIHYGIRYEDGAKMERIVNRVEDMLKNSPYIDQEKVIIVNFDKMSKSSLDFYHYCMANTVVWTEYTAIKQKIMLAVMKIIEEEGAEFAFPTTTINFDNNTIPQKLSNLKENND